MIRQICEPTDIDTLGQERSAFMAEAIPALQSGKLKNCETVVEGLDTAPAALIELLHSGAGNIGKMIVELSD